MLGLTFNYFNPNGISLIREKIELQLAPDSLFFDLNQETPIGDTESLSMMDSETDGEKIQKDIKPKEVVKEETKPEFSTPEKISEQVKEPIVFTEPKAVTLEQAYNLFNRQVVFVDARDEADYINGHIKNSINIPFDDFDNHQQKLEQISKEKPVVVYCGGTDCDLSHLLANLLFDKGYKQVYVFFGGWNDWLEAKYPTENASEQK